VELLVVIAVVAVIAILAATIPVDSKLIVCPYRAPTRFSILMGQTKEYDAAKSDPADGSERHRGICAERLRLYLL
jgi:hypothetical protein